MNKSESIKNIATALAQFNGEVYKIAKDAKNPQFGKGYVTLDALIGATRPLLQKHGLSIMQSPLARDNGEIGVQTMVIHDSGEYIESEPLYMTPVRMVKGGDFETAKDPQAAGSVISYLRRYSYQAILNLNTGEDDDGNKATPPQQQLENRDLTEKQLNRLYAIAKSANFDRDKVKEQVMKKYSIDVEKLSKAQYEAVCQGYESLKK